MKSAEGDDGDGYDSRVFVLCHALREAGVESPVRENLTQWELSLTVLNILLILPCMIVED